MKLLSVDNLAVSFDGRQVFSDLSFEVNQGDYLCILGENGSGKTTLMRCLTGNYTRYSGKIDYHGFNRSDIGWLPQRTDTISNFPTSVSEVVMSGFSGKSFLGLRYNKNMRKTALKNMEQLDLTELKNRSFKELSGGQQQRVLLCRALCAAQKVLLLDEPTAGLDVATQKELYTHIKHLHDNGMTIIMISHDIQRATEDATHVLYIANDGCSFSTAQEYHNPGSENI